MAEAQEDAPVRKQFPLHYGQLEIVGSQGIRTTVVTAGQGGGKTTGAYYWLWTRLRLFPGESHLIGFPNFPLLTRIILNQPDPDRMTIIDFMAAMGESPELHMMERRIALKHGQLFFGSGQELVGWEGSHVKSAWIDEFDETPLDAYKRAMERTRMRDGQVLLTGTPRQVRWVAEELQPKWESGDPTVKHIQFSSIDNPSYSKMAYAEAEATLPEWEFRRLYKGDLSAQRGGNVFRREWWQRYEELPFLSHIVQVWDTAFKEKTANDYSVCATWGVGPDGWYLIDLWRSKPDFPTLTAACIDLANRFNPNLVLIEDKASGQSLVQQLRRTTKLPVIPVPIGRNDDKYARASAVSGLVQAGRCFLPKWAPWVHDFIEEHAAFPEGAFDDQVDTTSMGLNYLSGKATQRPRARATSVRR